MKKNIALLLFALATLASCDKTNVNPDKLADFKNSPIPGYLNQPPYTDGVDELEGNDLELLDVITDSVLHSHAGWKFYDLKYSDTLKKGLKQTIGFTILSDKDLIGQVKNGGTNDDKNALKKYISVLAANDYSGYCLLYHALLEVDDPDFKKAKSSEILDYAKNDTFYNDAMQNPDAPTPTLNLVEVNYSYLDSLRVMSGQ